MMPAERNKCEGKMGARAPWRGESQGVYRYQVSVEKDHGETKKEIL